ncbi:four helix bundle protein [Autumnicola musiva]|uniref:Four helix bundle protein n=1 Tax=Autumnicola musiva TaxID=3075589 RepID=A0ABU3D336_9FLAO|nr:four helix bundle protein [Zunongwangia sp. F117]MDT0675942.1 four helix bundle protein [Zunongwangia sp. F117]
MYKFTAGFPEGKKFGLVKQLRRASISIPSNIAEGASREWAKNFSRFLEIAMSSCYEIETQILIANDLGFLNEKNLNELQLTLEAIIKMTLKFRFTLKKAV